MLLLGVGQHAAGGQASLVPTTMSSARVIGWGGDRSTGTIARR